MQYVIFDKRGNIFLFGYAYVSEGDVDRLMMAAARTDGARSQTAAHETHCETTLSCRALVLRHELQGTTSDETAREMTL